MKYILMMHAGAGPYQIASWAPEDIQRHVRFMMDLAKSLTESGEMIAGEGLAGPENAKRVRAGSNGEPITDGVFPESKEFLAGYWIVDVESPEQAYRIAARASSAPGQGGKPMNMPIEVREVLCAPPPEFL